MNNGIMTDMLIAITEMESPNAYLPFKIIRLPLDMLNLNQIVLPRIVKYFMGIFVLAVFWGFVGLLIQKILNWKLSLKQDSFSYHLFNADNKLLSDWRALFIIICISFITYFLAEAYFYPIPIGNDIWGNFNVLLGYYGHSLWEGSLLVYHSIPLSNAPLYAIQFRPFYFFFLYNLGEVWQISSEFITFIEAIPILFNILLSISIYGLSLRITNNSRVSLIAGITSTLSIGQLLMLRINIQETLGLIFMLCTLYSYLLLIDERRDKNLSLFILFFVMFNLVQFTHEQPFVILLTIILVHQTFCLLPKKWEKQVNINKKAIFRYLKQYFKERCKCLYIFFVATTSLIIRYCYAFFVRRGQIISLISSTSVSEAKCLPYCTLANMYGIPIIIFSFFGALLGVKSIKGRNKTFLLAFLFAALIYIFQAPIGITINPEPTRVPEEMYVPFIILAALGIDSLISNPAYTRVNMIFSLKRIKHKHKLNLNFLKYFIFFLILSFSCFKYVTDSCSIPRKYIIYPTEILFSKPEYEATLWLKSHIDPSKTIVIADTQYEAAVHCLSEFRVIRFNHYFLRPFSDYRENLIITLNRIIEYWLSKNYNVVVCWRNQDTLKNIVLPFSKIFDNGYVKLYLIKPSYNNFTITSIPYESNLVWNFDANLKNDTIQIHGAKLIYDSSLDRYVWCFDGINDYIEISSAVNLNNLNEITIEAWFKANSGERSYILSKLIGGWGWNTGFGLFICNNVIRAIFGKGGEGTNYYHLYSDVKVNDGLWHHVVAVAKPYDYAKIYVDGKISDHPNAIQETTTLELNNSKNLHIGADFGDYFNGSIALIRIFNKALNETEIAKLYWSSKSIIHVTHDGTTEDMPLLFEGYGPLTVNASIKLRGYINYTLSGVPSFLIFKDIFPPPSFLKIGEKKIYITAEDSEKEYIVMFNAIMSYSNIGWKDEAFTSGWLKRENETGIYITDGRVLRIGNNFVLGRIDRFTIEKQIAIDGKHYPYILFRALGERSLGKALRGEAFPSLSIMLHATNGKWIKVFNSEPTSNWDLYIIRIPPMEYDKIAIQLNDENNDIEGYHECSVDYILFAKWTPCCFPWLYYVSKDNRH